MGIHKDFPSSPYVILKPEIRWFPANKELNKTSIEKLLPPLVPKLRQKVYEWRGCGYPGASTTSHTLLNWWFNTPHPASQANGTAARFKYYFAQREAIETVIFLHECAKVKDKYDLFRFDGHNLVRPELVGETWRRFVIKMATGSGKTKAMSLLLAWSYFHKKYEKNSDLAKNFLITAPNIIVLDRLRTDFDGLKIFSVDPVLPENAFGGRNWRKDFQLSLHIQDEVSVLNPHGNIFLTNIQRVFDDNTPLPSFDDNNLMDYFLGSKPSRQATRLGVDLGQIVRDIDELIVINDEAHHIHDSTSAWFASIGDIHNKLKQKGTQLALQIDVSATPRHKNGAIFPQTIADYPLVEAITQNVVKHPVIPDEPSRNKLTEKQSSIFTEKYKDYIDLGVIEWSKTYKQHKKLGKKSVLFVMTDDIKNCDSVAKYLETTCPELNNAVLTIHTKQNGEIRENTNSKSSKEELETLRKQANDIDSWNSPYKAIVSVLMLKEGWDVRNVTTIVGLRVYSSPAKILPEQTLGRGLRRMYPEDNVEEYLSVVGTEAFMEFVESIQTEGVELEKRSMGLEAGSDNQLLLLIEVEKKGLKNLDIKIPVLTPRFFRDISNFHLLDVNTLKFQVVEYHQYSEKNLREIVFKDITTNEITHITAIDVATNIDYRSVVAYFTQTILRETRLYSAYAVLYPIVKKFIQQKLFGKPIDLENPNTIKNLSEPETSQTIIETFRVAIHALTVLDTQIMDIQRWMKISDTRPFLVKNQEYIVPKKSIFNKIVGDSGLELRFAQFLENAPDVIAYAKNYIQVNFKIDYINSDGNIANYFPDFFVKVSKEKIFIVETKGLEDSDDPLKIRRLKQWCEDANTSQTDIVFDFVYVTQREFDRLTRVGGRYRNELASFSELASVFTEYK